jgi:uncharacterized protein YbaA (DUF1428 family)
MAYVDGFVLTVPKKNIPAYLKMARKGRKLWRDHGALEYHEAIGDDLKVKFGLPFPKLAKSKPNETIIFAWIVYKSRAHRDRVNAKVMSDPRMKDAPEAMPFDMKKMAYGGFEIAV